MIESRDKKMVAATPESRANKAAEKKKRKEPVTA